MCFYVHLGRHRALRGDHARRRRGALQGAPQIPHFPERRGAPLPQRDGFVPPIAIQRFVSGSRVVPGGSRDSAQGDGKPRIGGAVQSWQWEIHVASAKLEIVHLFILLIKTVCFC